MHLKPNFRYLSLTFVKLRWDKIADSLATSWQNFAQFGLQLKLAFRIWPYQLNCQYTRHVSVKLQIVSFCCNF